MRNLFTIYKLATHNRVSDDLSENHDFHDAFRNIIIEKINM